MNWECEHNFAIYLAGAETPFWRKLLLENEASHVAINFKSLLERMNVERSWSVEEHFPGEVEVLVDAGSFGSEEEGFDHELHLQWYQEWVEANIERISLVVEYDADRSLDWRSAERSRWNVIVPREKFLPVWHEEDGPKALETLSEDYPRVAVSKPSASVEGRLRTIVRGTGVKIHGLGITGPEDISSLPLSTVSSTSWISPTKYGDTHVWAGGRFHWYPKRSSETARRRHSNDVTQAGFDADLFARGDRKEVARYTIWAWKQYEANVSSHQNRGEMGKLIAIRGGVDNPEDREGEGGPVSNGASPANTVELVRRPADLIFPGLNIRTEELDPTGKTGEEEPEKVQVSSVSESGLRQCSNCYLSDRCPAFSPGSTCRYKMPIEIRTRPQLDASLSAMLEMQMARVIFARAAEEADGSAINKDTSAEISMYMTMVEKLRAINSDPTFFEIKASGPQAAGILSQLLGQARGNQARQEAQAVDPQKAEQAVRQVLDIGSRE